MSNSTDSPELDKVPLSRTHPLEVRPARSATVDSIGYDPDIAGGDVGVFLEVEDTPRQSIIKNLGHSKPVPSHAYTFDIEDVASTGNNPRSKKIHFAFPYNRYVHDLNAKTGSQFLRHNRFRTFELRRSQGMASLGENVEQVIESWINILMCSEGVLKYAVSQLERKNISCPVITADESL